MPRLILLRMSALLASGLLAALIFGGCERSETLPPTDARPVIGVSLLNLSSEFIVLLRDAMQKEANSLGVRLIVNLDKKCCADDQQATQQRGRIQHLFEHKHTQRHPDYRFQIGIDAHL